MHDHRSRAVILLILALAVFFGRLGARDIVSSHEARVAQTARQMAAAGWPWDAHPLTVPAVEKVVQDGITRLAPSTTNPPLHVNPWLVPVMNGQIRLQKPPLPYWCAAILFRIFGGWSEWAARLIPALLGAMSVIPLWSLARRWGGRTRAFAAAIIWISTYFIAEQFRLAMADPFVAFFTLSGVWAWVAARGSPSVAPRRSAIFVFSLLFWLSMALGSLAKGPVIFLPAAIAILSYQLCYFRQRRSAFAAPLSTRFFAHCVGFSCFLLVAAPWFIYVVRTIPNVLDIWRYESVGEFADNVEKSRPAWFYIPQLFYIALPWTLLWILGICAAVNRGPWRALRKRRLPGANNPAVRWHGMFPTLWQFATVLVFSFSNVKKNTYLLPVSAAQTLVAAQGLSVLFALMRRAAHRCSAQSLAAAQSILGLVYALTIAFLLIQNPNGLALGAGAAILAAAVAVLSLIILYRPVRYSSRAWLLAIGASYSIAIAAHLAFYMPIRDAGRSAKAFASELPAELAANPRATLLVSRLPEEVALYLPLDIRYDPSKSTVWIVLDDPKHAPAKIEQFAARVNDGTVTNVRELKGTPRWRLFELKVLRDGPTNIR